MRVSDFDYELPRELIARYPLDKRSASRLLHLNPVNGSLSDYHFKDIIGFFAPGDLLVFNNTKVIPARVYGQKCTGGKIELLIERILPDNRLLTHLRASKSPQVGSELLLSGDQRAKVLSRHEALFELQMDSALDIFQWLEEVGEIPLPPYLDREAEASDKERYQTVFAEYPGAVAAPTAGLHFDEELLAAIAEKGIHSGYLTLHVGAGTFAPLRAEQIADGKLHAERIEVSAALCQQIRETKSRGNKVIAVGTTTVRALESAAAQRSDIQPYHGETDIFITPGFNFRVVDAMITNFHLPQSSLLMLVSAFAGFENVMNAYRYAVQHQYRFFSYGDAMLIGNCDL
ncbi:MAG: tRNA preQ1(34) S-adenosylmethionine ribosyltransferase-isomerase QueA [Gammaproteobacteria bacterium]|nr:tRNA preQ1(34) S-adenosylmethionine ribosyltransferase-isomerase QueA [Gammaproteobacteria bacterium]